MSLAELWTIMSLYSDAAPASDVAMKAEPM